MVSAAARSLALRGFPRSRLGLLRTLRRFAGLGARLASLRSRFFLEARAQRFHQIDHLRARLWRFGHRDLLTLDFLLYSRVDTCADVVGVRARIEGVGGLLLDQLRCELELR